MQEDILQAAGPEVNLDVVGSFVCLFGVGVVVRCGRIGDFCAGIYLAETVSA